MGLRFVFALDLVCVCFGSQAEPIMGLRLVFALVWLGSAWVWCVCVCVCVWQVRGSGVEVPMVRCGRSRGGRRQPLQPLQQPLGVMVPAGKVQVIDVVGMSQKRRHVSCIATEAE